MEPRPRLRMGVGRKLFLSHLLAVFLVSGSVGTFFYLSAMRSLMESLRGRLQNSAALLTHSIPKEDLDAIRGPQDMEAPAYRDNLARLRLLRHANPDIAFLYIMRQTDRGIEFVIDSDETDRQAEPGQAYDKAPASMQQGFHGASVDDKLYRDEWGVFLSGYAPVYGAEGRYMVGIDMRADEVGHKLLQLRLTGLVSLLASILLALLFAHQFSRGMTGRIGVLIGRCRAIAAGTFTAPAWTRGGDEFDDLADAFDAMSAELSRARGEADRALADLREARDGLETRVRERTAELERALDKVQVLRGLLPICVSCKKVRDDQGYWQQVERFVEAHTDARFTHGYCPACAARFLGDIADA